MKMLFILGCVKGHGYRVLEFYKDGSKRVSTIDRASTKLRMKKSEFKYELNDGGSGVILSSAVAERMLIKWGHEFHYTA